MAAKTGYQIVQARSLSKRALLKWQIIVAAFASLLIANTAFADSSPNKPSIDFSVVVTKDLAYGPLSEERGDLYLPKGVTKPPPIVVVIHGGAWVSRDRADNVALSRMLASRGIAAFNIDYRLANSLKPGTRWPAQIVDSQLAVRWLRAKSNELGVDGTRIGALGASSGAHLASMLGTMSDIVPGKEAALWPNENPRVMAVVDLFGPTDISNMPSWINNVYPALFGTSRPTTRMLSSMSPLSSVSANSAHFLIVQGDKDVVVPRAQSIGFETVLHQNGVPVVFVAYPGGHEFTGLDIPSIWALNRTVVDWMVTQLAP